MVWKRDALKPKSPESVSTKKEVGGDLDQPGITGV